MAKQAQPALTTRWQDQDRQDHAQNAYRTLRQLIVHGRLAPGNRLVEADLAQRLGISRTPLRTALLLLQQEGYVVAFGNGRQSRLSVAPLTSEDAYELWWVVGALEGVAARWAAKLPEKTRMRLVRELRRINKELAELARRGRSDTNRIFELDAGFHRAYVEASAGSRILTLHRTIKPQTERYWRLYSSSIVDQLSQSVQEHQRIIEAFERGDAEEAMRAAEANWHNGAERLVKVIEALGERGSW